MGTYHEAEKQKDILYLRSLLKELPPFLEEFFIGISQRTATKTRVGYALDLRIFFYYLLKNHPKFQVFDTMQQFPIESLNWIEVEDIDRFLEYVSYYSMPDFQNPDKIMEYHNDERGKARKLSSIRSMYRFFYKRKKAAANPAAIADIPIIHEKPITRLDAAEAAQLLDEVEFGQQLTEKQKINHEKSKKRDLAIISLLLGTGMRVSECVGIDRKDLNFRDNSVKIIRKGGNEVFLYFGEEVRQALVDYLAQRASLRTKNPDDDALFISRVGSRITPRAVQNLVKKYASVVTPSKKISPHKLRSTFGTNLYQETGDIYLVADALGHSDINTTQKHYAAMEESRRKNAAKYIKLRKD